MAQTKEMREKFWKDSINHEMLFKKADRERLEAMRELEELKWLPNLFHPGDKLKMNEHTGYISMWDYKQLKSENEKLQTTVREVQAEIEARNALKNIEIVWMQKEVEDILGIVKPWEREEELKRKIEQCCNMIKILEENISKRDALILNIQEESS